MMSEEDRAYSDARFAKVDAKFTEMRVYFDTKFAEAMTYTDERSEKSEKRLLNAFHGWARSTEIRLSVSATQISGMEERLALAESRISDLERHKDGS